MLRSFGKFYGLAGLRLGFVIGSPAVAARVRGLIGDWPVSVDAMAAGLAAYADHCLGGPDAQAARRLLPADSMVLLTRYGFEVVGGTSLYRLVRAADAPARFERLAAAGILTRPFQHDATLLRFGLPGSPEAWRRLEQALAAAMAFVMLWIWRSMHGSCMPDSRLGGDGRLSRLAACADSASGCVGGNRYQRARAALEQPAVLVRRRAAVGMCCGTSRDRRRGRSGGCGRGRNCRRLVCGRRTAMRRAQEVASIIPIVVPA